MKRFKFLVGAVALFAVVAANVWNAAITLQETELSLVDVEALAGAEGGVVSNTGMFWEFQSITEIRDEWHNYGSISEHVTYYDATFICKKSYDWNDANCKAGDEGHGLHVVGYRHESNNLLENRYTYDPEAKRIFVH